MFEDSSCDAIRANSMCKPAMLRTRIHEVGQSCLAYPPETLHFARVNDAPKARVNLRQPVHRVHNQSVGCSKRHSGGAPLCRHRITTGRSSMRSPPRNVVYSFDATLGAQSCRTILEYRPCFTWLFCHLCHIIRGLRRKSNAEISTSNLANRTRQADQATSKSPQIRAEGAGQGARR